jgi:hypothetical protein
VVTTIFLGYNLDESYCKLIRSTYKVSRSQAKAYSRKALKEGNFAGAVGWDMLAEKLTEAIKETKKMCP